MCFDLRCIAFFVPGLPLVDLLNAINALFNLGCEFLMVKNGPCDHLLFARPSKKWMDTPAVFSHCEPLNFRSTNRNAHTRRNLDNRILVDAGILQGSANGNVHSFSRRNGDFLMGENGTLGHWVFACPGGQKVCGHPGRFHALETPSLFV